MPWHFDSKIPKKAPPSSGCESSPLPLEVAVVAVVPGEVLRRCKTERFEWFIYQGNYILQWTRGLPIDLQTLASIQCYFAIFEIHSDSRFLRHMTCLYIMVSLQICGDEAIPSSFTHGSMRRDLFKPAKHRSFRWDYLSYCHVHCMVALHRAHGPCVPTCGHGDVFEMRCRWVNR